MILEIEDVYTAIDRGWEHLSNLQLLMAKRSRVSGDITMYNKNQLTCVILYANISALESIPLNHNIDDNKLIKKLYNNIKLITKNFKRWD